MYGFQKAVDFEILMSYNQPAVKIVCASKIVRSERDVAERTTILALG